MKGSGPSLVNIRAQSNAGTWLPRGSDTGRQYVFFVEGEQGRFVESPCRGTQALDSDEVLAFLKWVESLTGPGTRPEQLSPPQGTPQPPEREQHRPRTLPLDEEQALREREEMIADFERRGGTFHSYGPHRAGETITVAGKEIQLPEDAYVSGVIVTILCGAGNKCPPMPRYTIVRGDWITSVGIHTGDVTTAYKRDGREPLPEGAEDPFAFLREALGETPQPPNTSLALGLAVSALLSGIGGLGIAVVRRRK